MRRIALAFATLAAILIPLGTLGRVAHAADFRAEGDTLFLDGAIVRGDLDQCRGMLGANPEVKRVSFNSPGGDLMTGLQIGKLIRERKLETFVEGGMREAASAAAYAFMGGEKRIIKGVRGVGVHAFYTPAVQVRAMLKQKSGDELVATINEFERSTQESTMAVVEYAMTMIGDTRIVGEAVKSGSDAMLWLSADRLLELKVATEKIDLRPEEIPTVEWAVGETVATLAAWLTPGHAPADAAANAADPDDALPLDERERATLEQYLANDAAQSALRTDIEGLLSRMNPPNRIRAREMLVLPLTRSVIAGVRASVRSAREAEAAAPPAERP
jgi:hypothetical protein